MTHNAFDLSIHAKLEADLEALSTVGAGFVGGLFDVCERLGVPRAALIQHANIDLMLRGKGHGDDRGADVRPANRQESRPDARWPMQEVIALFNAATTLTGKVDLGLAFGQQTRPGTFHVLGYALMTCKTIGEAIELVPHYRRLVFDIGYSEMQFRSTADEAQLGWEVVSKALPYCPSLAESLIAAWYSFGRWIAGVDLPLKEVRFSHAGPKDALSYAQYFGCPVRFGTNDNALVFSRKLLAMPLVQADETLHLAMREQARAAIEKTFNAGDIAPRLRQALIPLMPKYEATLDKASASLAMSARTLQRRLAEQGLQFQDVLDATRKDLAKIYLKDPSLGMLDVALLLGYSEQSSFTRAFKSWFGDTPSGWRRQTQIRLIA
mgnify:CR=1 FL=1